MVDHCVDDRLDAGAGEGRDEGPEVTLAAVVGVEVVQLNLKGSRAKQIAWECHMGCHMGVSHVSVTWESHMGVSHGGVKDLIGGASRRKVMELIN